MKFCPICKSLQTIETLNNKQYLICKACQTSEPYNEKELIIQNEKPIRKQTGKGFTQKEISGHNFKCEKCNNTNCKLTDLGMMIGDEDWVYLLECTKCGHGQRVGEWC